MLFTEVTSSVEEVQRALVDGRSGHQLADADELIVTHVDELRRRLRRLKERGVTMEVRLSPSVEALQARVTAHREVRG